MIYRTKTKKVYVKDLQIGSQNKVVIQSMTSFKTSDYDKVIEEIKYLADRGCELIRVSVLDDEDIKSLDKICKESPIPVVADIHFVGDLAIKAIDAGVAKIRINPSNTSLEDLVKIVNKCKENNVAIRLGINGGSFEATGIKKTPENLIKYTDKYVKLIESMGFYNLVISIKCSDPELTYKTYKLAAKKFKYPLHIGLTEAGDTLTSCVKSTYALTKLLEEGIGDTIRTSINGPRIDEIRACKEILRLTKINQNTANLISCPRCGRCMIDTLPILEKVKDYLDTCNKKITVAIMGCAVNGPGEAKDADIGIAGSNKKAILFKNGIIIKTINENEILPTLIDEINKF